MKPYYQHAGITIFCGDCREILADIKFDAVVTDPPYGVLLAAKRAKQRGGGVIARAGSYCFEDTPEYIRDVVVPAISLCRVYAKRTALTPGTRNLWLYPPADDIGCFFSAAGTGMGKWGFTCSQPILYYGSDPFLEASLGSRANSCGQTYPNDANEQAHPCAKPMPMMRWLVARATAPTDTVCDPFMGSGTTLVAAKNLGRKAIGIEIEERYCEISAKRLSQEVLSFDNEEQRTSVQGSLLARVGREESTDQDSNLFDLPL
jgi:site-specific DNA-methyltransferase (adenine-specific)